MKDLIRIMFQINWVNNEYCGFGMTVSVNVVTVSMIGPKSGMEGEEIILRMQIKRGAKIAKGMKLFGKKVKQDLQSLAFFVGKQQLTGQEVAGTLDGASIFVEGIK